MDFTMLTTRFREWKAELMRIPVNNHSVPAATSSPEWYTGLAVSPASFSRQLGDMQLSLLRANGSRIEDKQVAIGADIMQPNGRRR
jgi:hypothetical protein